MPLPDSVHLSLFAETLARLERIEASMATNAGELAIQQGIADVRAAVAGVSAQVGEIIDRLAAVEAKLADQPDLSQEAAELQAIVASLNAEKDKLDAAVPDEAPVPPPAPPAP